MSYVTVQLAKDQVAVIHAVDDALIQQCVDAAENFACQFMNRDAIVDDPVRSWRRRPRCTPTALPNEPGEWSTDYPLQSTTDFSDPVPKAVVQAILLYAADFYEHRTSGANSMVFKNPAAEALLHFYRLDLGV